MPYPGHDRVVLLTGFPNFGARRLAEHLLEYHTKLLLYVVVKDMFTRTATELVDRYPASWRKRIVMLAGDAVGMDLGLSGAEFREVSARIDYMFHFAQTTNPKADKNTARMMNVQSTREAVEMAIASPSLRCLVMLSTASVSGMQKGAVLENELRAGQRFRTVIEESKAQAERIARRAMNKVPIAILRPSTIVGDSQTGEVERFDGPYTLMMLILTSPSHAPIPLPAPGDGPLNLVPIDYVVSATRQIGFDPRAPGRTFHLVDPAPLPARRVFELVAHAAGFRSHRGFIPTHLARALLRTPGIDRFSKSPRTYLRMLSTDVQYDARNAEELLKGTGIMCPPFESYVDQLVNYVQERIRETRRAETYRNQEVDDPLS